MTYFSLFLYLHIFINIIKCGYYILIGIFFVTDFVYIYFSRHVIFFKKHTIYNWPYDIWSYNDNLTIYTWTFILFPTFAIINDALMNIFVHKDLFTSLVISPLKFSRSRIIGIRNMNRFSGTRHILPISLLGKLYTSISKTTDHLFYTALPNVGIMDFKILAKSDRWRIIYWCWFNLNCYRLQWGWDFFLLFTANI